MRLFPSGGGRDGHVLSIAFSEGGRRIVWGSSDTTVRVWDATTSHEVLKLEGHRAEVHSVAFSPDERRIASGSSDCTVRIWDAISGAALFQPLGGHINKVHAVTFSTDGRHITSTSLYHTITHDGASGHLDHHSLRVKKFDNPLSKVKKSDNHSPNSESIIITADGWAVDFVTGRTLYQLHPTFSRSCYATHGASLAFGAENGPLVVIHCPPALFTSPETRAVEGKGRLVDRPLVKGDAFDEQDGSNSCVVEDEARRHTDRLPHIEYGLPV